MLCMSNHLCILCVGKHTPTIHTYLTYTHQLLGSGNLCMILTDAAKSPVTLSTNLHCSHDHEILSFTPVHAACLQSFIFCSSFT